MATDSDEEDSRNNAIPQTLSRSLFEQERSNQQSTNIGHTLASASWQLSQPPSFAPPDSYTGSNVFAQQQHTHPLTHNQYDLLLPQQYNHQHHQGRATFNPAQEAINLTDFYLGGNIFPNNQQGPVASQQEQQQQQEQASSSTNYSITPSSTLLFGDQGGLDDNMDLRRASLSGGKGKGRLGEGLALAEEPTRMQRDDEDEEDDDEEEGDEASPPPSDGPHDADLWSGLSPQRQHTLSEGDTPSQRKLQHHTSIKARRTSTDGNKIQKVILTQGPPSRSSSSTTTNNNTNSGESSSQQLRHLCPHPDCDKHFSTSGHARRHSRIHGNFRPFTCPHPGCHATFTRNDNLQQHRRNRHPPS